MRRGSAAKLTPGAPVIMGTLAFKSRRCLSSNCFTLAFSDLAQAMEVCPVMQGWLALHVLQLLLNRLDGAVASQLLLPPMPRQFDLT